ncbi:MAG: hypothetical protein ACQESG_05545 [Nanobdellota archaeon]
MKAHQLKERLREIRDEPGLMLDDTHMEDCFQLSREVHSMCTEPLQNKSQIETLRDIYEEFGINANPIYDALIEADNQKKELQEQHQAAYESLKDQGRHLLSAMDTKTPVQTELPKQPGLEHITQTLERIVPRINDQSYTAKDYATLAALFQEDVPCGPVNHSEQETIPATLKSILDMYEGLVSIESEVYIWHDKRIELDDWTKEKTHALADITGYKAEIKIEESYSTIRLFKEAE